MIPYPGSYDWNGKSAYIPLRILGGDIVELRYEPATDLIHCGSSATARRSLLSAWRASVRPPTENGFLPPSARVCCVLGRQGDLIVSIDGRSDGCRKLLVMCAMIRRRTTKVRDRRRQR